MRTRLLPIAAAILLVSGATEGFAAPRRSFPLWACSDGKGTISLFWLPPEGRWPARGFQLERVVRGKKTVLARNLGPAQDAAATAAIDPGDAAEIRTLAARIGAASLTDEERRESIAVNGRTAAADIPYGRALGVRYADAAGGAGKRVYRLTALGEDGSPGETLESGEVDPARRTPGPERPSELKAAAGRDGVALTWRDPPADAVSPVVAYHVERAGASGKTVPLTRKPVVLNRHLKRDAPEYLDPAPPREPVSYLVRSLDIFGRRSAPVRVKVTASELAAAAPGRPALPAARADGVVIALRIPGDAKAAGYVVERSHRQDGPYEPLAPSPSSGAAARYEDEASPKDAEYYYRIRYAGPRGSSAVPPPPRAGETGPVPEEVLPTPPDPAGSVPVAASPVAATVEAAPVPPAPAEASPAPAAIAPSVPPVVAAVSPAPAAIPPSVPSVAATPGPRTEAPGSATATDGQAPREPAGERERPAEEPSITSIQGMNGKVIITLNPGFRPDGGLQILVIRSETPGSPGVPVGRPFPAETVRWEDTTVEAGQSFWYRVVQVDRHGTRGASSKPRWVRVFGVEGTTVR